MRLIEINNSSVVDCELMVCVHPLLELVMIETTKVLVTLRIVGNLNRHSEGGLGKAKQNFVVCFVMNRATKYMLIVVMYGGYLS